MVTVTVSLAPVFQRPRFRAFRASLFAALGLWGIAPAFHGFLLHRGVEAVQRSFAHDLVMGGIYLVLPHVIRPLSCTPRRRPVRQGAGRAAGFAHDHARAAFGGIHLAPFCGPPLGALQCLSVCDLGGWNTLETSAAPSV